MIRGAAAVWFDWYIRPPGWTAQSRRHAQAMVRQGAECSESLEEFERETAAAVDPDDRRFARMVRKLLVRFFAWVAAFLLRPCPIAVAWPLPDQPVMARPLELLTPIAPDGPPNLAVARLINGPEAIAA